MVEKKLNSKTTRRGKAKPVRAARPQRVAASTKRPNAHASAHPVNLLERVSDDSEAFDPQINYRSIFENSMEGIFQSTPQGRYIVVNLAMARIYGYDSPQDMIDSVTDIQGQICVDPETRDEFIAVLASKGFVEKFEAPNLRKDGSVIWTRTTARAVKDAEGRSLYYEGFTTDITERKRAEERLHVSELRFRTLVNQSPIGIFETDKNGNCLFVNERWMQISGLTSEEASGYGWTRGIYEGDWANVLVEWKRAASSGHHFDMQYRFQTPQGVETWVQGLAAPIRDNEGKVTGYYGTITDITERKRAEAERERLLNVLEASLNEIYIFAPDTLKFQYVNTGAVHNLGYTRDQLEMLTPIDLKPELTEASFREMIGPLLRREKDEHIFQTVHRRVDDSRYPVEVHLQLIESAGDPIFLAVILDITERKHAEEKLRESEEKYRDLVETSHDLIWSVDGEGRITFVNQATEHLYGYKPEELVGHTFFKFIDADRYNSAVFKESIAHADRFIEVESHVVHRDGTKRTLSANSVVRRDREGNVIAITGSSRDITERQRAGAELRLSRDRLAKLSRQLVQTHETESRAIGRELHDQIGQMLTALKLNIEIAPQLPPELAAKKFAQAQELVSDLLNRVSRLSLELRPPVLDDLGLVPALLWHINRYQVQTNIAVDFKHSGAEGKRFDPEVETTAYRIVQESLTNVARHSHATRARLEVRVSGERMEIRIGDNGIGFDPQAALALHRGLSGMRERVNLLGGSFQIESQPGAGTKKFFQLPLSEKTT